MAATRTIASATPVELEILALVKDAGREIAREGMLFDWSLATIAAVAYQRGLLHGIASQRERAAAKGGERG